MVRLAGVEPAYPNLEVLTVERDAENFLYPQLGYINIPSFSERKNGSRFNTYEAANIAQWLADNREKILSHYQVTNLSELVAIVTPFKLQASTLKKQLREKLPEADAKKIVVGTVHKMQGAEKKIVLFSPVYGMNDNTMRFVDQKLNILNVAVSRAKDSFLVFGNLELFDAKSDQPSGILAKHLRFETGENELKDFQLIGRSIPATIEHLTTLEGHQKALTTCFNTAQRELIIVSPFITMNALKHDRIHETITETTRRGVSVTIYADVSCVRFVNQNNELATNQITELLKSTGARLHYGHGIHNKTIKVDDHTIIEGSFNWLSANRGSFAKLEHSIVYRGNEVKEFGKKIEESLANIRTSS